MQPRQLWFSRKFFSRKYFRIFQKIFRIFSLPSFLWKKCKISRKSLRNVNKNLRRNVSFDGNPKPNTCCIPKIFQTMNSVRLTNLSLKYQWITPSVCKIWGFENFSLWQRLNYRFEICLLSLCTDYSIIRVY